MEVMLAGDARETLEALLPRLTKRTSTKSQREVAKHVSDWRTKAESQATAPANPLNPQLVVREMSKQLPDGAIISGDSSGMSALIDVAKHFREWKDRRLIVVVLNNRDLNYVTWEQRVMEGEPKFERSQSLPDINYADYAKLLGLDGVRVDAPDQVASAWTSALTSDRPFIIDAVVDANVPTLPPVVRPELEEMLAKAVSSGDPDAEGVREQIAMQGIEGAH